MGAEDWVPVTFGGPALETICWIIISLAEHSKINLFSCLFALCPPYTGV
jgi:hypothetical protein